MTGPDGTGDLWERLLPALEAPCPACEGTGTVYSGDWRAWHERAGELVRVAQAARRATDLHLARAALARPVPHGARPNATQQNGAQPNGAQPTVPEGIPQISQDPDAAQGSSGAAREIGTPAIVTVIDRAIGDHMRSRPDGPERVRCATCGGCGRTLTAAGAGLTEFLARHGLAPGEPCPPAVNAHGGGAVQPDEDPVPDTPRGRREH
ncbi:hypothetical protein [Actinomadura sp. 9N407]|uniref:hypothetical protein n=1 Tax=Actinomadura sp. 9N407 TaxID=3375154 RepID=UPI00378BC001